MLFRSVGATGRADPHRVAGQSLGPGERAIEHRGLGEGGQDRRPLERRPDRDQIDGPLEGGQRAGPVARRASVAAETLVQQAKRDAIAALVERAENGLDGQLRAPPTWVFTGVPMWEFSAVSSSRPTWKKFCNWTF